MIRYASGDATQPDVAGPRILAHLNNDKGGWGKGFVLAVSKRWREPEAAYRSWARIGVFAGLPFTLGNTQFVEIEAEPDLIVANMIAQCGYGRNNVPPIRYDALAKCLRSVFKRAKDMQATVCMPRIGTGLAGGRWEIVEPLILDAQRMHPAQAVVYLPGR